VDQKRQKMSDKQAIKVGDTVKWSSQAGGYCKEKTGKVIGIVQKGERPERVLGNRLGYTLNDCYPMFDGILPVSKTRYLILVENGRGKPKIYCPTKEISTSDHFRDAKGKIRNET
jgi:hypothetical protein